MSVPESVIQIMSVPPIDNRYEHTLYFDSLTEQNAYFQKHIVKTFTGYTFLRPTWSIKVEADFATTHTWHYLRFHNATGKMYYYFINKVHYINDHTVELDLEMDVIQTYMFNWSLPSCFIERTHTKDKWGENTMEEGLETGPLIDCKVIDYAFTDLCIMVLTAVDGDRYSAYSNVYDKVFSGLRIYAVNVTDYEDFGVYLDSLSEAGKIDAIVSMWMYPKELVRIQGEWDSDALLKTVICAEFGVETTIPNFLDVEAVKHFGGYVPKNNKLYCYPYSFIYVTNNMGGSAIFRNERFNSFHAEHTFNLYGGLSPDSGVKCVPNDYNGNYTAYDDGLSLGSFPTCAWDSDTYKVWLAQNQNSQDLAIQQAKITALGGALTSVGSVATGNLMGAVGGLATAYHGYNQVQSIMAQRADMAVQPPQARGSHSANVNLTNEKHGFSFHYKCITKEYAQAIDEYFSRYGYKVNRIMEPNLKARENFTYIKTLGCTVGGNVPMEDRQRIANIFDNGITFWANHNIIGYYGSNPV